MSVPRKFLIVGIGASAGGIEALRTFFQYVPADSDMAYVVILHLSPDYESQLAGILQLTAKIPVAQLTEKVHVEPNHVYVIAPSMHLEMIDGYIDVTPNISFEERRAPVDIFFRTLADSHETRAVAVILSGTGANGSMGIKRIKEKGGVAFVQQPGEAQFNEMPLNSIQTDLIDAILPVAHIPLKIIDYRNSLGTVEIPAEPEERLDEQQKSLREIFLHLRLKTGHDFSNYKTPTLLRRIERRMNVRAVPGLTDYVKLMQEHPDEIQALLKDLLISVTNFFRDPLAFEAIEKTVLPDIFRNKKAEDQVRIWISGCATGEEAYSLAMLCAELTMGAPDAAQVQIFATDIDEDALTIARDGIYTLNDAADVSPDRLRRFFIQDGNEFKVRRELREMILFANHNILKDPPFSHLHLATCRNMLIYLNKQAQQRVMETMHFALNPGGYLFLGSSESVDGAGDLYATVSRENHIFRSRHVNTRIIPVTEGFPTLRYQLAKEKHTSAEAENRLFARVSFGDLHQQMLEQYAPPSLIVNENFDVLHSSEKAGTYMLFTGGEPTHNVLRLIRPELRLELRAALYSAVNKHNNVHTKPLQVRINEKDETVRLQVRPVLQQSDRARGFFLILIEPAKEETGSAARIYTSDESVARHLEEELMRTKEQLNSSAEQHDLQSEELKAANEELQALNEELRSAAEELETGKEELQSINEELRTVNQELKIKIDDITHTSNNLQNLINSTHIASIFLDRGFKVVLFTPTAREVFNLIPADIGRPLSDITSKLSGEGLLADARMVLDNLQTIEREVSTSNDRHYTMRLLPYRTAEDRINGVVITFYDVTERRKAQQDLQVSEEKYRSLFDSIDEGYCIIQMIYDDAGKAIDWRFCQVNRAFEMNNGLYNAEGKTILELAPDIEPKWMDIYDNVAQTGEPLRFEEDSIALQRMFSLYAFRIGDPGERKVAVIFTDITGRKQLEQNQTILTDISQELLDLNNFGEAAERLSEKIGTYFSVKWCLFSELTDDPDMSVNSSGWNDETVASIQGMYRMREFLSEKQLAKNNRGELTIVSDTQTDPNVNAESYEALGIRSLIIVPLSRSGQWRFMIFVIDTKPRVWRGDEIDLLQTITDRIWVRLERARAEKTLRESEERKSYLLKVSDAVRTFSDPAQIQNVIAQTAMDWFKADRCYYCELDGDTATIRRDAYCSGMAPVAGTYPLNELPAFKAFMQRGESLIVGDVRSSEALDDGLKQFCISAQAIAFINLPVYKKNNLVGRFCIMQSEPRVWTEFEVELAKETAERTWTAVERGKAEEALRETEERMRLATAAASIYSWEYDIPTGVYSFSNNASGILGVSRLPQTVEDASRLVHPEDKDLVDEKFNTSLREGKGFSVDFRSIRENGNTIWLSVQTTMLTDAAGKASRLLGIAQDITDRRQAQEDLQYSETKLRIVNSASGIGTWLWNIEEDRYEPDNRMLDLFGNPTGGITHLRHIAAHIHKQDLPCFRKAIEDACDEEGSHTLNIEFRLLKPDGTIRWVQSTGQTFFEGNPKHAVMMAGSIMDITERKEAEAALRQSEERYRTIFYQATTGTSEMDIKGNITLANEMFCNALQYTLEEMLTKNFRDITHPDDLAHGVFLFNQTVQTGYSFTNDKRLIRADGSFMWITDTLSAIQDENGTTKSVLAIGIDITERKKTEIFIHESEERYRIALEAGELATWDWNLKTDKVSWNEQHFRLFGVEHEADSITPEYFLSFIYPEDISLVKQQLGEVVGKTGIYTAEFRIRRHDDNKLRWMSGYGRVTERENGKPTRVSGVMYDSTERREAQDSLEETKNSLDTALEAAKMGVWTMDMTNGFDSMDRSSKHDELLGFQSWQEECSIEKGKTNIIGEDKRAYDEAFKNLRANGVLDLRARVNQADGHTCWVQYFGRTFRNEDGKGETAAGVIFDITDQKTLEKQKDEFIGVASHELKTPVTSIKAYAEILQEMFTDKGDTESASLMGKLDTQVDRLTNLIKDLLDVTKISEGQLHLTTTGFNMEAMIQDVAEDMQRTTRQHKISVSVSSLPEVTGDKERLAQVLVNMLSNAIKYSPGAKEVAVKAAFEDNAVRISVQDFGIGMSPGTLEKLFARFFRSDNPSVRSFPGLGLGLYISMEIMKRHGGTISVESERGKGSIFTMILPVTS